MLALIELYEKHNKLQDEHIKLLEEHLVTLKLFNESFSKEQVIEIVRLAWATASAYGDKTNEADCMDWINKNVLNEE
jgi:hypothetical protein